MLNPFVFVEIGLRVVLVIVCAVVAGLLAFWRSDP